MKVPDIDVSSSMIQFSEFRIGRLDLTRNWPIECSFSLANQVLPSSGRFNRVSMF